MKSNKRSLKYVSKNFKVDSDELLVSLWDSFGTKYTYLENENSIIKRKDYYNVKKFINSEKNKTSTIKRKNLQEKPVNVIQRDHDFSSIGKLILPITYITKDEVMKIYEELVSDFDELEDPIQPSGVKDEDLLNSAVFHGRTSYENNIKYPTIESAAAALMYAISHNHAFHNGNKRTAMVAMLVFLDKHHISLTCNEDDLFKISLKLADHKLVAPEYLYPDAEIFELSRWIHNNSKVFKKGERPIKLKKLKQIFEHFDCIILESGKVQRTIKGSFWTGEKILVSRRIVANTITDGQEVDKGLIKSIREDLQLNPDNSIDSDIFYEKSEFTISDFINKYKTLLRRLSKV